MGLLDDLEFLKKKRKPNLLANVQQLQRPAEPYLRQQYPEVYGGLGGLLGIAPDEMAGSILDPNTARVRAGAQIGFPVGTAAQVLPMARPAQAAAMAAGRAGERLAERVVPRVMERGGMGAEMLQGMSRNTVSPLDVYHGSPHKFDRFDASKIGTGEGAQVYGHGLYFAESPDTAKYYQQLVLNELKADPYNASVINRFMGKSATPINNGGEGLGAYALADASKAPFVYDPVLAMKNLRDKARELRIPNPLLDALGIDPTDPAINKANFDAARKYIRDFSSKTDGTGAISHFYKVDLPDEQIAKMLDWDKPLSEQHPQVQAVFNNLPRFQDPYIASKSTAGEAYGELSGILGGREKASEALRQAGIPGIKYLDATSRGAGTGTRNFVTFPGEEQSMTILERNGQPMIVRPPQQAAFDPFRRNALIAAAMGVAAPNLMAAPIGGIGLGAGTQDNEMPDAVRQYMANPTLGLLQDEEERKKLGGLLFR